MNRIFFTAILLIIINSVIMADSYAKRHRILIDTDAGIDDMRAICLILANKDIDVLGITTSDGMCDPLTGYQKVRSLLQFLGHEGIPVAAGVPLPGKRESLTRFSYTLKWGPEADTTTGEPGAERLINYLISSQTDQVTLVALGPLTNYSTALSTNPLIASRISRILWFNDGIDPLRGDNHSFDPKSYEVIRNLRIPVNIISQADGQEIVFDKELLEAAERIPSRYTLAIQQAFRDSLMTDKINRGHLGLWDDLVSIYLTEPESFILNQANEKEQLYYYVPRLEQEVRDLFISILADDHVDNQVFLTFPVEQEIFAEDVHAVMNGIVLHRGMEEWRAGVITNELHGHLGVYAIIGTKMGLRARDYFRAGHDQLEILSYAGTAPPISCMNDGLQVSTGATLGHGLIRVREQSEAVPAAAFSFRNRWIDVRLKEAYRDQIRLDIEKAIHQYGNLTADYWQRIRELAIRYWLEWDRYELFTIHELRGP